MIKWVIIAAVAFLALALILYHVLPVVSAVRAIFQQQPEDAEAAGHPGGIQEEVERD